MITSLGLKAKLRPHKCKKERYAIRNVSNKDILKIIREFEELTYEIYEKKIPKHETTDSSFLPARQLSKCMTRDDDLNLDNYPLRTDMTTTKKIPTTHVCYTDESRLK